MTDVGELLKRNHTLRRLDLRGNPIKRNDDLKALLQGLTHNISVTEFEYEICP